MAKGLWALRSARPFFERTHWAPALLKTKEDGGKGWALEHTPHGGLRCSGNAELLSPPTPHQAELESLQDTCRGVCLAGALAGVSKGSPWSLEQGKPAGPKAQVEGVEGTCGVDTGEQTQGLGERQRCDGWAGGVRSQEPCEGARA